VQRGNELARQFIDLKKHTGYGMLGYTPEEYITHIKQQRVTDL